MSDAPDYGAVYEGQCPHGHGPLELQEERGSRFGWCDTCKTGWSAKRTAEENTVHLHLRLKSSSLDGGPQMGPGLATLIASEADGPAAG